MSDRYRVERLPNGMIRVFDLASKLAGCYHADGTYRHGALRAATIAELLGDEEQDQFCENHSTEVVRLLLTYVLYYTLSGSCLYLSNCTFSDIAHPNCPAVYSHLLHFSSPVVQCQGTAAATRTSSMKVVATERSSLVSNPEPEICVRTIARIPLPPQEQGDAFLEPLHVSVDDALARIYVTMLYRTAASLAGNEPDPSIPGFLAMVNAVTHAVEYIPLNLPPRDVAVDPKTHRVFVTHNTGPGHVSVVDGAATSPQVIGAPIEIQRNPLGVAVDAEARRVYVAHAVDGMLTVLNADEPFTPLSDEARVISLQGESGIQIDRIAVDANRIYVPAIKTTDPVGARLYVIDAGTEAFTHVDLQGVSSRARDVAVDPVTKRIYVVSFGNANFVSVLSQDPLTELFPPIQIPGLTPVIRVDPQLSLVYVATRGGLSLEGIGAGMNVIDGNAMSSAEALFKLPPNAPQPNPQAPLGAWGLVISTQSHLVYIANAREKTLSVVAVTRGPSMPMVCL